jgi:hypothetical protein
MGKYNRGDEVSLEKASAKDSLWKAGHMFVERRKGTNNPHCLSGNENPPKFLHSVTHDFPSLVA